MLKKLWRQSFHSTILIAVGLILCTGLAITHSQEVKADDLPVTHISGSLSENQTWTNDHVYVVDGSVVVPAGVTLIIEAGTIVKGTLPWSWFSVINVSGGILQVEGTASDPVRFTSIKDDSLGGDSGNDGPSSPASGDYFTAITNSGGATISIGHAQFKFAARPIDLGCSGSLSAAIIDSDLDNGVKLSSCEANNISMQRNNFHLTSPGYAIDMFQTDPSGISMAGPNKNTFSGTGQATTLNMLNGHISSGQSWTVNNSNATLYARNFNLDGALTLDEGTVFKNDVNNGNSGISVNAGATLSIAGSASNPVVFTSAKDDGVNGDSLDDGPTSGETGIYTTAISGQGGTINISHATLRYAVYALNVGCGAPFGTTNVNISDSLFNSGLYASNCSQGSINLQRNHFDIFSPESFAIEANYTDIRGVALAGSDQNTFTGTGKPVAVKWFDSSVAPNTTVAISNTTGAVLYTNNIAVDGVLQLDGALVVKLNPGGMNGFTVSPQGQMLVNGTSNSPMKITSATDDSIGGDTTGNGNSSGQDAWYTRFVGMSSGSTVQVSNVDVKYAAYAFGVDGGQLNVTNADIDHVSYGFYAPITGQLTIDSTSISNASYGVYAGGDAHVIFRGTLNSISTRGIQACDWQQSCLVDASYVDWGSADGPRPASGWMACGSVYVSPWKYGANTYNGDGGTLFPENCNGSPTPGQQVTNSINNFQQRIAAKQIDCSGGFQDACDAISTAMTCLGGAVNVAQSTSPWPLPPASTAQEVNAFGGLIRDSAATYLTSQASPSALGSGLSFFNQVIGVAGTMLTMADAYNSCAP